MPDWQITTDLEKAGLRVVKLLKAKGFQAFWVGGIVRNFILKRESDNLDIATDAKPDEVVRALANERIYVKPVGKQFGSILAIIQGHKIEITTFRAEGHYSDNRHPDKVEFIKDYLADAKRRDFTINALYFDPLTKELFDPGNGLKDFKLKLLRFVGDPKKRIDEDGLRMLRGVRLATELGFKLEKNSFAAIKTRAKYIQSISGERIKAELDRILLSENRVEGLKLLDSIGLLRFIIPEFEALKKFSHNSKLYHLEGNQFEHTILALSKTKSANLDLLYALLFHDIGKPQVATEVLKNNELVLSTKGHNETSAAIFADFAKRLKFPRQNTQTIDWLIRNHMWMTKFKDLEEVKQYELVIHPAFELLIEHWRCDEEACERVDDNDLHSQNYHTSDTLAKAWMTNLKANAKIVDKLGRGEVIMKYSSLKPGKLLGEKLNEIKAYIVLGKIKTESDLKKYLQTKNAS